MEPELRGGFHRELDLLSISLAALLGLVPEAVLDATGALLGEDPQIAQAVERWRNLVNDLYADVVRTAETIVARQAPVAGDLRLLFAAVRMVPTLYDTVDLIADVASPANRGVGRQLSDRTRYLTAELGAATAETWSGVGRLWDARDIAHLAALRQRDDALADIRSTFVAEVAAGQLDVSTAMEMALVGRSFERIGRHATTAGAVIAGLVPRSRPQVLP